MWGYSRTIQSLKTDPNTSVQELLLNASRNLMGVSAVFFAVCILILSGNVPPLLIPPMFLAMALVAVCFRICYALRASRPLLSQALWLAALFAAMIYFTRLTGRAEIVLLAAMLPMLALVALGSAGGLAAGAAAAALAFWASGPALPAPLSPALGWAVVALAAFGGLVGWAVTEPLLTAASWSLYSFESARQRLEETREQRVELLQTRDDLMQANRELARLTERMKALQKIAEDARQAKAEFVANVSHELRTPLNMIIGFTEMISQYPHYYGGRLPPALLTDIAAIRRNSEHLTSLINDVLDLSQVETGRMALHREWTSLEEVVAQAVAVVEGLFKAKNLELATRVEEGLPQVFCDATRIREVIINLLSNAGRFTENGCVTVSCFLREKEVIIQVRDTGPGIESKDQQRIFEPFQQADTFIRRKYGGSGLGLTISKQFIEMHYGRMWLESQAGVGSQISFSLPLEPALDGEAPDPATQSLSPAGFRSPVGFRRSITPDDESGYHLRRRPSLAPAPEVTPRFVVVEQENTLRQLLARYFPGAEVASCADIPAALEEINRAPAHLLVLNRSPYLPLPEGLPTDLPYSTPLFHCWLPGQAEAARRLGVLQYLMKPLSREKMLEALDRSGEQARTIMIVDDEPDELHLFVRWLGSAQRGYTILQVSDGLRALEMMRARKPDIVLLDLMMPGLDGFGVLEEKSRDPSIRDIPVIIISAHDPTGEPVISSSFSVTHGGSLSAASLMECMRAVSAVLSPREVE